MNRNQLPEIRGFIEIWQHEILRLVQEVGSSIDPVGSGLTTGRCVIYPCKDAVVVLIYTRPDNNISLEMRLPLEVTVADFTRQNQAMRFYDQNDHWEPGYPRITVGNDLHIEFRRIGGGITLENYTGYPGKTFHQRFNNVVAVGWYADISDPYLTALEYFQRNTAAKNIGARSVIDDAGRKQIFLNVLSQFKLLLDTVSNEEEVQDFLKNNPVLLYPAYSRVEAKFKLGKDYITDFVFVVQTRHGKEWVLVEIERPNKELFTQDGRVSHKFTQAQNQLLDWELWVEKNQVYLQQDFPGIRRPVYHLVIGRNIEMTSDEREKLRTLEKPNHVYSTYDDIVEQFETLINRMFSR